MTNIFSPITIGDLTLKNRIFMSPLTRTRASQGRVPNELMAEYYRQRASAGLIFTEATSVAPQGVGYPNTPGIWSEEQVQGWMKVTEAVHKEGGTIFLQLWHVGRISDPMYLHGELPVAPSAIAASGHVSLVRPIKEYVTPRALELSEIPEVIKAFKVGAENAKRAGFDGVEVHAANGYLLDQFLQDGSNKRTDQYGGSVENRARLILEITDAVVEVWGASRVGVHIAPRGDSHSMGDSNPLATFGYLVQELSRRNIAFICAREHMGEGRIGPELRKLFSGVYIANEKFDLQLAEKIIKNGEADAVAFGVLFIANPDLPRRFQESTKLNQPDSATFYSEGPHGYTDYPTL